MMRIHTFGAALLGAALLASPAAAQIPDAKTLLTNLGFSSDQIGQVMSGQIVRGAISPASDRELVAAMAFMVKQTPAQLIPDVKAGVGNKVDESMKGFGTFTGAGSVTDMAKLTFGSDAQKRANQYLQASPGGDLNLSSDEIASFNALAAQSPTPATVEGAVRQALLVRLQAYQQKGLAGIAPYARSSGVRSPADELRTMTNAAVGLKQYVPHAWQMLNSYPEGKPAGAEEVFRWTHFDAHGTPAISLQHGIFIPDGDAWVVVQRMFYVSSSLNAEQALLALLPAQGGTVVVYGNRTSTDQVSGWGGAAKRSIGSKVLESQLESIFQKARSAVGK